MMGKDGISTEERDITLALTKVFEWMEQQVECEVLTDQGAWVGTVVVSVDWSDYDVREAKIGCLDRFKYREMPRSAMAPVPKIIVRGKELSTRLRRCENVVNNE